MASKKRMCLQRAVMTNKPPQGPYRGAGRPEAAFFMERMMDLLADELGMEADEVRLINTTTENFKSPLGLEIEASRPFFKQSRLRLKIQGKVDKAKRQGSDFSFYFQPFGEENLQG